MTSIVIPTLNEENEIPATLEALARNPEAHEIIVVDAGSKDHTPRIAAAQGACVVQSPHRQRAAQLNLGAGISQGETILFLHADTHVPPDALAKIQCALQDTRIGGGGFRRYFDLPSPFLRLTCELANVRAGVLGWFLGDQAIFVRRTLFRELSGYADFDLFEDLDFSRRLRGRVKTVLLRTAVLSSGRRFAKRGALRTSLSDAWLTLRYLSGTPPNQLARELRESRPMPTH